MVTSLSKTPVVQSEWILGSHPRDPGSNPGRSVFNLFHTQSEMIRKDKSINWLTYDGAMMLMVACPPSKWFVRVRILLVSFLSF